MGNELPESIITGPTLLRSKCGLQCKMSLTPLQWLVSLCKCFLLSIKQSIKRSKSDDCVPSCASWELTYMKKLLVLVGHTQCSLAIEFARGRVKVPFLGEGGEMGNAVRQPETLRAVKEQCPCRTHTNIRKLEWLHTDTCEPARRRRKISISCVKAADKSQMRSWRDQTDGLCPFPPPTTPYCRQRKPRPYWFFLFPKLD